LNKKKSYYIYIISAIILLLTANFILFKPKPKLNTTSSKRIKFQHKNQVCTEYEYYSWQLNDSIHHYLEKSYLSGIKKNLNNPNEIEPFIKNGNLKYIQDNKYFVIDSLKYSYPYLIPEAKILLTEIAESFQKKLTNTNLNGIRLIVTSVLRTSSSIKKLRKKNKNAIKYSAHLHGTTFDIDYSEYDHNEKLTLTEKEILRDILASTLYDLRKKEKCWVTFEKNQSCFHIVSRGKA